MIKIKATFEILMPYALLVVYASIGWKTLLLRNLGESRSSAFQSAPLQTLDKRQVIIATTIKRSNHLEGVENEILSSCIVYYESHGGIYAKSAFISR